MYNISRAAEGRAKTVREAFDLFLGRFEFAVRAGARSVETLAMHRAHAGYWLERIGRVTKVGELDERRIDRLVEKERTGRRRAILNQTLNKRVSTLRQALAAVGHRPAFPSIPYRYTPRPEHLPDFGAYCQLRDALSLRRRLWFVTAVWTGQRRSDVESMLREHLSCPDEWVMIASTKTRLGRRKFAAAPELVRELDDHWAGLAYGAPLVEPWPHAEKELARLSTRLGLPLTTPQRLRHTCMTWFVAANGFTPELLEFGGWSSMAIPARVYAHAAPARLREQIARMHDVVVIAALNAPEKVLPPAIGPAKEMGPAMLPAPPGPNSRAEGTNLCATGDRTRLHRQNEIALSLGSDSVGPAGIEPAAYGLKVQFPVADGVGSLAEREPTCTQRPPIRSDRPIPRPLASPPA